MKYSHLATRLFGAPLLMERGKLETIVRVFGQRAGVEIHMNGAAPAASEPAAYGPGDSGGGGRKPYFVTAEGIAVINIMGPLVKRASGDFMSGGPTTYGEVEAEFMDAIKDPLIKGILLAVDSPGGETVGCFELADLIHAQRGKKPIYAAADGDAFSAAYALASSADRVFVTKSGGVGSVGVWMAHVDQSEFDKEMGVKVTYIFAGARKIDGNCHEPLSPEAYTVFKAEVDRIYDMFIETVARNRGLKADAVRATEAGLFFGSNAVDIKFADQVGTLNDALSGLIGKVQQSNTVATATYPKTGGLMETPETTAGAPSNAAPPAPPANAEGQLPEASATSEAKGFARAAEIVGLCALAGFSAEAAQKFLKPEASIEDAQKNILAARAAAEGGSEIHSHILPNAGANAGKTKTEDSPLAKACAERAGTKEGK